MIIVTGGAGFIGSNIIAGLNARGRKDILVVDNMKNGQKMQNLADLDVTDYLDRDDFMRRIRSGDKIGEVEAVFHQGACSDTTEWDGKFMMQNNFEYSKELLHWCQKNDSQFLFASSASVYGIAKNGFTENRQCELPINIYGYSKFQFDQYVRSYTRKRSTQVVGLRYFNVYGPREAHKGTMSSTPYKFNNQIFLENECKLFAGSDGYGDGEQERDFIFVEDCVMVNLWFWENPDKSGIYNVGTGKARSFNDVARAVIGWHKEHRGVKGSIRYISFPENLKKSYQSFTKADLKALREIGFTGEFHDVETGVAKYLDWLNSR